MDSPSQIISKINEKLSSERKNKSIELTPTWVEEVSKIRKSKLPTDDEEISWESHMKYDGKGAAPWIQEVVEKKKLQAETELKDQNKPEWIKELEEKKSELTNLVLYKPE